MQNEQWEQLKENLKRKFNYEEEKFEEILVDTAEGQVKQGEREYLVVETPMGKIKLARESRPVVLEKKFYYTHRQGASAQTEYKFSDTEKAHKLKIYKWDDKEDDWKEIKAESLGAFT